VPEGRVRASAQPSAKASVRALHTDPLPNKRTARLGAGPRKAPTDAYAPSVPIRCCRCVLLCAGASRRAFVATGKPPRITRSGSGLRPPFCERTRGVPARALPLRPRQSARSGGSVLGPRPAARIALWETVRRRMISTDGERPHDRIFDKSISGWPERVGGQVRPPARLGVRDNGLSCRRNPTTCQDPWPSSTLTALVEVRLRTGVPGAPTTP